LPKKEEKWFIRPHHVESLTSHANSLKDDVLNTRYFSHYNQQYGKPKEENKHELAMKAIQKKLEELKTKQI